MEAAIGLGVELKDGTFEDGSRSRKATPGTVDEGEPFAHPSVKFVVVTHTAACCDEYGGPLPPLTPVATPDHGTLPAITTSPHPPLTIRLPGRYMDRPGAQLEAGSEPVTTLNYHNTDLVMTYLSYHTIT